MPKIIDGKDPYSIDIAVDVLSTGNIIALPTETVYGLAADALNENAIQKIFEIKDRPLINPLICHVHEDFDLSKYVEITKNAQILMDHFWPGPLSIIFTLKKTAPIAPSVTAGLSSIAFRAPRHDIFQKILKHFDRPIAAPSANKSESLSPTRAEHVNDSLKKSDIYIIDGLVTNIGIESTIIDTRFKTPALLRYGAVAAEDIENCLHCPIEIKTTPEKKGKILSPGQMLRHYSPNKKLKINITHPKKDEAWLSFGPHNFSHEFEFNLSVTGNLNEAAQNLFSFLWKADKLNVKSISVAPIPNHSIGIAINDRLKRAAGEI